MKAIEHEDYSKEIPEFFPCRWYESPKVDEIATAITEHIRQAHSRAELRLIPGLRAALNIIAERAELVEWA